MKPDPETSIDNRMLMRLVDGEMKSAELRNALRQLDAQPENWRKCALAFLEDQALRQELRPMDGDSAAGRSTSLATRSAAIPTVNTLSGERDVQPPANATRARWFAPGTWSQWASMAALVVLAFGLGRFVDWSPPQATPGVGNVVESRSPWSSESPAKSQVAPYFVVDDENWDGGSVVPWEIQNKLRQQGTDVLTQRGLLPMRLPDGRRMTIPYEDVQLVPVRGTSH